MNGDNNGSEEPSCQWQLHSDKVYFRPAIPPSGFAL